MKTAETPPLPSRQWLEKLAAALLALLLYEASQGCTSAPCRTVSLSRVCLEQIRLDRLLRAPLLAAGTCAAFDRHPGPRQVLGMGCQFPQPATIPQILWKFCVSCFAVASALAAEQPWFTRQPALGLFAPPTPANMAGWLSFEWVFVGVSEEILFRGFLQTFLSRSRNGAWKLRRVAIPHAGLVCAPGSFASLITIRCILTFIGSSSSLPLASACTTAQSITAPAAC
jgi:hypothetical protein